MKRTTLCVLTLAVALTLAGTNAFAQRGGGHAGGMGGGGAVGGGGMGGPGMAGGEMNRGGTMRGTEPNANMPSMQTRNPDQVLSQNTQLSSRLQTLLPGGTNLQQAASGFKNLGQFIAAVHVSHNLGIPFDELKAKMTGPNSVSLGKAIQQLKPDVNAKEEIKRANKQAKQELNANGHAGGASS